MRLIDADKIDYIMGEKPSSLDYVRRAHIADEPTVEAIPVKWLADFCYKCEKETQQLSEIRLAIETWRKENETNRCR